jgi:hypothetical protein
MKPLSADTTIDTQRVQFELMQKLPGWKRLTLALNLTHGLRELVLSDIRQRYPDAPPEEIRERFIARVLAREDVIRVYGFDPREKDY